MHESKIIVPITKLEMVPVAMLRPHERNARNHSVQHIKQLAKSMLRFGFTIPVLIDDEMKILAGHARVEAAKLLKLISVPVVRATHLSETDKRAFLIADNKLAAKGRWNRKLLIDELGLLAREEVPLEVLGFGERECEKLLSLTPLEARSTSDRDDRLPALRKSTVTRPGDVWQLGSHRLYCADPTEPDALGQLVGAELAALCFSSIAHRSLSTKDAGSLDPADEGELIRFLLETVGNAQAFTRPGALFFLSVTWRQMSAVLRATKQLSLGLVDVCVWVSGKGSAGGSSQSSGPNGGSYELVFVLRNGGEESSAKIWPQQRTGVWDFASPARTKAQRSLERLLGRQKPVQMIVEAIIDSSEAGDILVGSCDKFGTSLIAAEKTARVAWIVEKDPRTCDLIVQRFMLHTSSTAQLAASGCDFARVATERGAEGREPRSKKRSGKAVDLTVAHTAD